MSRKTSLHVFIFISLLGMLMGITNPSSVAHAASSAYISIAAGADHTCALTSRGGIKCWGNNNSWALGNNTSQTSTAPMDVPELNRGITALTAGRGFSCVLTVEGEVRCWGSNIYGQLGNGVDFSNSHIPTKVMGLSGVTAISSGENHTCALMNGGVKCWGSNSFGQLGIELQSVSNAPVDVNGLSSEAIAISAGQYHTCAILTDGSTKCWGRNTFGQLGNGTEANSSVPVTVIGLSSATDISAGNRNTCALVGGHVKCWGNNDYGQLGNGTKVRSYIPVDVIGLSDTISGVSTGSENVCAMTVAGGVKCWGYNQYGQVGDGTFTERFQPVDVIGMNNGVTSIDAGNEHVCAINNDGSIKCWGRGDGGQLGDGTTGMAYTPTSVVSLDSGVDAISTTGDFTCALTSNGGVKCWGYNVSGNLGNGTFNNSNIPVDVIGLDSGVQSVSSGGLHTCALISGKVKCWGDNFYGQLGNGSDSPSPIPTSVIGLPNDIIAISLGWTYTCALTNTGSVKCWGDNSYGQLGDGTMNSSRSPVDVVGLSNGVVKISTGQGHTCALINDGSVKCWGGNNVGQLGDGTFINRSTPVTVPGLIATTIEIGWASSCALTSGQGARCWGNNAAGQLGNGTNTNSPTPVKVVNLPDQINAISVGIGHACVITSLNEIKCWGANIFGELGNGSTLQSNTPVNVIELGGQAVAVTTGYKNTCAITSMKQVKCWGANTYGELGNGKDPWSNVPVDVVTVPSSPIFTDVPINYWANPWIESLHNSGISSGCGYGNYCPESNVTRAQMAIFLLRAEHGASYEPPTATGTIFNDIDVNYWAAAWVEQLAAEKITSGCGIEKFCPDATVTRDQMAIFLLRTKYGADYIPSPAIGLFNDVPIGYWAAPWIEQLAQEGITTGCAGGNYCPTISVNRAEMAVFIVRAFNLP